MASACEFGPFRLEVAEFRLLRRGVRIPLTQKAFAILEALVGQAGHLVTKDELMRTVWPETVVEEANLANNVSLLRRVLRDRKREPRYIETIPRRGYRFVAHVHMIPDMQPCHALPTAAETQSVAAMPSRLLSADDAHSQLGDAHMRYLKGRYFLTKITAGGLKRATEYFREAIEIDPRHARAYAGLAESYCWLSHFYLPTRETMPKAREAAEQALALDPCAAEAQRALALVRMWYEWDWSAAERSYLQALRLEPASTTTLQWFAFDLAIQGRRDASLGCMRQALTLDPLSPSLRACMAWLLYCARGYDDCIVEAEQAAELDPSLPIAPYARGLARTQQGRLDDAVASLRRSVELSEGGPEFIAALGCAQALAGDRHGARHV